MAVVWVGGGFMPTILSVSALAAQAGYRDNAPTYFFTAVSFAPTNRLR
jgi:hypothetical protein